VTPQALGRVLTVVLLVVPAMARGQSPTAAPHPTMPWSGIVTPHGQLIRFVYMPPQPLTLEYLVAGAPAAPLPAEPPAAAGDAEPRPADAPPAEPAPAATPPPIPQIVRQQVTIPGYYVRETTVGYHYPERWSIEQAAPNVYRWRMLPAQFVPK
jgi:hypothetical protein